MHRNRTKGITNIQRLIIFENLEVCWNFFKRRLVAQNWCGHLIDKIGGYLECSRQKTNWHWCMMKKCKSCFNHMTVFAFSCTDHLKCVRWWLKMLNTKVGECMIEALIFFTSIWIDIWIEVSKKFSTMFLNCSKMDVTSKFF